MKIYCSPVLDSFEFDDDGKSVNISVGFETDTKTMEELKITLREFGSFLPPEHKYPLGTRVYIKSSLVKDKGDVHVLGYVDGYDIASGLYMIKYDNGGFGWLDEREVADIALE